MKRFEIPERQHLFFMHIPKTAGTSMRTYLANQYSVESRCPANTWAEAIRLTKPMSAYRLVQGHFQYNLRGALDPETKVVAAVREPVARTLSGLMHLKRDPAFHADHALAKNYSIKQILRMPPLMLRQQNIQSAAFCASASPSVILERMRAGPSGFDAAELEEKPTLSLAVARAKEVEFLGATDNLWMLLQQMSEELAMHPSAGLPLINNAPDRVSPMSTLDAEDLELIRSYNQVDIPFYERCLEIIEQREFQRQMLSLVNQGVYVQMDGSFDIDLAEPMPGSGWYSPESQSGRSWRWTGPDARFTLELPLHADARYRVMMSLGGRSLDEHGLGVRANGHDLPVTLTGNGSSYEASVDFGPDILAESHGCCRLIFDLGTTIRAQGGDIRPLGAAVNRVSFERVD